MVFLCAGRLEGEIFVRLTEGVGILQKSGAATVEVQDSHEDTLIGEQPRKESIMGGIIVVIESVHGSHSYAIKTQRKARNTSIMRCVFMA